MRNLWIRIGLGAVGVFACGMLILTLFHNAQVSAKRAFMSLIGPEPASAATLPEAPGAPVAPEAALHAASGKLAAMAARLASLHAGHGHADHNMTFRLDGEPIGRIEHLSIRRAHRGELPEVSLLVLLHDGFDPGRLADCELLPVDDADVAGDPGFTCARPGRPGLTTIGTARIEPLGITRPIRLTPRAAGELRRGDPFDMTADAGGPVRVNARGDDGQAVRVLADSTGASIKIDDALGRAVFRLLADSSGASLRVRGKDGRDVVRMEAANGSFSLTVDSAAAP